MAEKGFKRKLAAILSADVEGYSRLMDDDEEATVRTLTVYRTAIDDLVQKYRGRVVDTPGDNILAEFTSVVDAVNCAVEIQRELAERNAELPYNRKMEFRIGVNLGDVIEEEGRIYGDGVNIAARVEAMAEAGGICITGRAYDQVANKLGLEYENLGEHQVKNITTPIRVFRVLSFPGAAAHRVVKVKETFKRKWRKIAFSTAVVVVVVVILGIWQFYMRRSTIEPASVEKMAMPLPDRPSVVVLPFDDFSDDPEQEYLADGITDQIITGLSKMPYIFIIARNTSMTYNGKPVKIQQVAEELGVQYVLEGSVQHSGNRIRVTALLIDAFTGRHVWSERYDRLLEDIFALQDEIMVNIMRAMEVKVAGLAMMQYQTSPHSVEAYLKILKAIELVYHFNKDDNASARKLYEEAIVLDPEHGSAYQLLGWTYCHEATFGWTDDAAKSLAKAEELGKKAISLGSTLGHMLLMSVYDFQRQYEKALAEGEKALAIIPNSANLNILFSDVLSNLGRHEEAIARAKRAIRLNPHHQPWYYIFLGCCYFDAGKNEEALEAFQLMPKKNILIWIYLASIYSQLGREAEAKQAAKEVHRIAPDFSLEKNRAGGSF